MQAKLITTDLLQAQYWQESTLEATQFDCVHALCIYPSATGQTLQGFGGAFTEASAWNWQRLPAEKQAQLLESYFGESGLRYSLGRVHIGSCDFSLGNYACMTAQTDHDFYTERDEQYLLPFVQQAQRAAGRKIRLLVSPWSPPPFMKTNGEMNHGGKLKREFYPLWADCVAKYVRFYREQGCDVEMVSIQNEPAATQSWDSCIYSASEEGEFSVFLRRALAQAGCEDVKILAWDHNKEALVSRAQETLSVPGAQACVDGFALHWYTGDHFEAVALAHRLWPDKALWFTEGCVEYSRFDGADGIGKAEMYAHDILGNLKNGVCGSIDWNLLLDAKGGPNHAGNFCEAPIMVTPDGTDFVQMGEYYYIGQFSRYLLPGARRVESSCYSTHLESVVFRNPDGEYVLIALNRTREDLPLCVQAEAGKGFFLKIKKHTIATLRWQGAIEK